MKKNLKRALSVLTAVILVLSMNVVTFASTTHTVELGGRRNNGVLYTVTNVTDSREAFYDNMAGYYGAHSDSIHDVFALYQEINPLVQSSDTTDEFKDRFSWFTDSYTNDLDIFLETSLVGARIFYANSPVTFNFTQNWTLNDVWWTGEPDDFEHEWERDGYGYAVSGHVTFRNPGTYFLIVYFSGEGQLTEYICVVVDGDAPAAQPQPTPAPPVLNPINVTINGAAQSFDPPPQIIDSRTMLPLRAVGEALGMEVAYDSETRTATLTSPGTIITHVIGTDQVTVNGVTSAPVPGANSVVIDGRTLVPLRMIAEATGADVDWDGDSRTVSITSN